MTGIEISSFKIPAGLDVKVWAAEPMLSNPVAISVDEKGRASVAEAHRIGKGVEDNRGHMNWLDDDMASTTVPDRYKVYAKHIKDVDKTYGAASELIRVLEDRSGHGVADHESIFRDDFHDVLDGVGAGILARHGDVYYACIPNLWLPARHEGHGQGRLPPVAAVRFWRPHLADGTRSARAVHGPRWQALFSQGDRGFHLVTREGKTIANPDTGGVFRCNPDGSDIELFAVGVRIRRNWPSTIMEICSLATITPIPAIGPVGFISSKGATPAGGCRFSLPTAAPGIASESGTRPPAQCLHRAAGWLARRWARGVGLLSRHGLVRPVAGALFLVRFPRQCRRQRRAPLR